jgi:hypothetical protein
MTKKVKLQDSDWNVLFPAEDFVIGTTKLELIPLSLSGLARVTRKITQIIDKVNTLNLDFTDLQNASKIVELVALLLSDAPDILSEMSGLDVEDIQRLPLDTGVALFNTCLDVNLKSQENLTKNFKGLGEKVARFMGNRTVQ